MAAEKTIERAWARMVTQKIQEKLQEPAMVQMLQQIDCPITEYDVICDLIEEEFALAKGI